MRIYLVNYLESNSYLPDDEQHDFRTQRSTLTQLLFFWNSIIDKLEEGTGVDIIYTDFSKAFDKVETGVLLHKIKDCRISGKVGLWLSSFLDANSRQRAVQVDGCVSDLSPVISGVPQGTEHCVWPSTVPNPYHGHCMWPFCRYKSYLFCR